MPNASFLVDLLSRIWVISWQSTVIAGLVLLLRITFGRAITSRWRHALWALVLCRLLMPVLPQSHISLFGLSDKFRSLVAQKAVAVVNPIALSQASTSVRTSIVYGPRATDPIPHSETETPPAIPLWKQPIVLATTWLAVALGLMIRLAVVNFRFHRRLNRHSIDADPRVRSLLEECCRKMRITTATLSRNPKLIITDLVDAPAVCGVLRPRILLPPGLANTLSEPPLRLILLHELAHIKCRDIAIDWLWAGLQSLHWFNPVLWLIAPLRRNDRELARDEMVLSLTGPDQADRYGRTLLELAQPVRLPLFCPGLVGMFSGKNHLQRRIEMVARFKGQRIAGHWIGIALLIAAAGCALTSPTRDRAAAPAKTPATTAATTSPSIALQRQSLAAMTNEYTEDLNDPDRPSPADAAVLAKLDQHVPEIRFNGNALNDAIDFLRDTSGLNIYVDWPALNRAGVAKDAPVTARLRDIKISKALELIFKSVEGNDDDRKLGYAVDNGVVTISTRAELDKNVVTRRYDINDLLFVPADYNNVADLTQPNTSKKPASQGGKPAPSYDESRASRIDEIKQFIIDNVAPYSWKEKGGKVGSISSSPLRAVMMITQTPENQRNIRAVLESLRASHGLQLSLETRFIILDETDEAQLPAAIQQRLATVHGAGRLRTDQVLQQNEVSSLVRSLQQVKSTAIMTCPRLTLFNGQTAAIVVESQQAYVAGMKVTPSSNPAGKPTYEPQTETTPATAITEKVTVCSAPDRASAFVDLHFQSARLLALLPEHWAGAPPDVNATFQQPVTSIVKLDKACAIPDRGTLLLACPLEDRPAGPSTSQPSTIDPQITEVVEQDQHRHAYLLIKPTILMDKRNDKKDAMLWDSTGE